MNEALHTFWLLVIMFISTAVGLVVIVALGDGVEWIWRRQRDR